MIKVFALEEQWVIRENEELEYQKMVEAFLEL